MRNKCLRLWMDERGGPGICRHDVQCSCAVLAKDYPCASCLNSHAPQASADRAWFAISRFYDNCKAHKPGKKGYPRFHHAPSSMEYKTTGWKLAPDGKHITLADGCGSGRVPLLGKPKQKIAAVPTEQIKRVRIVHRADGYCVQLAVKAEREIVHHPRGIDVGRCGSQRRQSSPLPQSGTAIETRAACCLSHTKAEEQSQEGQEATGKSAYLISRCACL
jgi:putative transposase